MKIELHSAFVWDCNECGRENFERAIEGYAKDDWFEEVEEDAITEFFVCMGQEVDTSDEITLITRVAVFPQQVTCKHCNCKFSTEVYLGVEE